MMNTIFAVLKDITRYFDPRTKVGFMKFGILVVVTIFLLTTLSKDTVQPDAIEPQLPTVTTNLVSSLSNSFQLDLIGSVEAIAQAEIQTESAGRITQVNVSLGQTVQAGTIIAQLENASQYATLLQAEGLYEAAVASAAQSDIGVREAQNLLTVALNNAKDSIRNSYISANTVTLGSLDTFYSNPTEGLIGLRVSGGNTSYLNAERVALRSILKDWNALTSQDISEDTALEDLDTAITNISRIINLFDAFIQITTDAGISDTLNGSTLNSYNTTLLANRQTLSTQLNGLINARTTILSAQESLRKVQLGGTSGDISASNAQVKQALGTLRSAQASYNKTILRTPISGVVNSLSVKVGDFVNSFTKISTISNNTALEVTTFVGESDRNNIAIGDLVLINRNIEGLITAIAPAVDSTTGKIEVKIGTDSDKLTTGDSVSLTITPTSLRNNVNSSIRVPLTSVKLTSDKAYVFTVEDGRLKQHEVELGKPNGSSVTILSGLDTTWEIVVDARGLIDGNSVRVITN